MSSRRWKPADLDQHAGAAFRFDAIETEGRIRFVMRGRAAALTLAHDDLVAPNAGGGSGSGDGELLELVRAQETELPQALKWQVARADEDYDAALVEARRITSTRRALPPRPSLSRVPRGGRTSLSPRADGSLDRPRERQFSSAAFETGA